jgi:uncharacterized protein (UPF0276 family)
MKNLNLPTYGGGAGLRNEHFDEIVSSWPDFNWFEIIIENFMGFGGRPKYMFDQIRERYPIIPHGVCMSIGSTDPLDMEYLKKLKAFTKEIKAPWMSDHLCYTMIDHSNLNELIPTPFTKESADNIVSRIRTIQDYLELPFLIENVTRYLTISEEMTESEFINYILKEADCGLLLDLTNVYLNSIHHGYDAMGFVKSLPLERVTQIHLAGSENTDNEYLDTHDAPVPDEVWAMFRETVSIIGKTSALVEWDSNLPSLERLLAEAKMADQIINDISKRKVAHGA